MSLCLLEVPPADVAAEALGLLLRAAAPPALAQVELADGDGRLVLGVLGSSHVVTAVRGGSTFTERVSCDALGDGGTPLPDDLADGGYRVRTSTTTVGAAELDRTARLLRDRSATDPAWLCGVFPTSGAALTALAGRPEPRGWSWRSWHLYPGGDGGVVVRTASRWAA